MFYPIFIKNQEIITVKEDEFVKIYDKKEKIFNDDYLNELIKEYEVK